MSGAGNLFVVIDNRSAGFSLELLQQLSPILCAESDVLEGKKAEGLIALESVEHDAEFSALFFNPDGSFGAMCGNGARCIVEYVAVLARSQSKTYQFSMAGSAYIADRISPELVRLYFSSPSSFLPVNIQLDSGKTVSGIYVDVGSDHLVVDCSQFFSDAHSFWNSDLVEFAIPLRSHSMFSKHQGVNVNIFFRDGGESLLMRTYERGVEAETGACGTGAVSTALAAAHLYGLLSPLHLTPTSRQELTVAFEGSPDSALQIALQGSATILGVADIAVRKEK